MSVGVNVAPQVGNTVEGRDIPKMERLLTDLRPDAVRFGWDLNNQRVKDTIRFCNGAGIDVVLIDNPIVDANGAFVYEPEQFVGDVATMEAAGLHVAALEGWNEPDGPGGRPETVIGVAQLAAVTDRQQRLYAAAAGQWPVLTPSSVFRINDYTLATLPGDIVSAHRYPDIYGDPPSAALATLPVTDKPVWVTETGIPTRKIHYGFLGLQSKYQVTEAQQAVWLPQFRDMLVANGAARVMIYRLQNSGSDLFNPAQNFGLYRWDGTAKPAATAFRGT